MKYYISFNTKEMRPNIVAVSVDISRELIRDDHKKMRVDLCDSPLYKDLERYVLANPSKGKG